VSLDTRSPKRMPPLLWYSHISTHMTLDFNLWPWKPFQQCPLTWWIFVQFHWNPSTK